MNVPDTEHMSFSEALERVKDGADIARAGWNGAGQYVFMVRPPQSAAPDEPKYEVSLSDRYTVPQGLQPFLMLHNAQGGYCPWVPSTGDLFAEDWIEK